MKALAVLALLLPAAASAAVADSAANGFTIKLNYTIQAAPKDVYQRLVHNVGDWWSPDHTFSHDAHNLSIEEKPMGCFCEKMPGGGGVRHLEVVHFVPGKFLVMQGGLGPMQALAVTGTLTIELAPDGSGTKLDVTYAVGGYLARGLDNFAAPVNGVLGQQFDRLKLYVETGKPAAK
jgi:uncharacterized protein YndB with AHSA1/START domain